MNPQKLKLLLFLVCILAVVIMSTGPLSDLLRNGRPAEYYTHIQLIPVVSAYVLFRRRTRLFPGERGAPLAGILILGVGLALFAIDKVRHPALIGHVELSVSGAILFLAGSYIALFGRRSFVLALFPFLFLVFMMPLPAAWMERIVSILVTGATRATHLLFGAFHVPFVSEGTVFRLPGFDLEVARECSGIRSSLALLITSVLAGQIFLKPRWKKIALAVAVLPITVLKNAVRIVTLYMLSHFIDIRIIERGFLHRSGGFILFGLGLVMLAVVRWILTRPREAWARIIGAPSPRANRTLDKRPTSSDSADGKESGGFD